MELALFNRKTVRKQSGIELRLELKKFAVVITATHPNDARISLIGENAEGFVRNIDL
jgi:hypothetical protein